MPLIKELKEKIELIKRNDDQAKEEYMDAMMNNELRANLS